MTKTKKALILAKKKGYKVQKDGSVIGVRGKKLKLKTTTGTPKYYTFNIKMNGESYPIPVHSYISFLKYDDDYFKKGVCARHLDGNSLNNDWNNIAIGSYSDNMFDIPKETRQRKAEYASSFIKIHNHHKIIEYYKKGDVTYQDIMTEFNISSKGTVSYIINNNL